MFLFLKSKHRIIVFQLKKTASEYPGAVSSLTVLTWGLLTFSCKFIRTPSANRENWSVRGIDRKKIQDVAERTDPEIRTHARKDSSLSQVKSPRSQKRCQASKENR